MQWSLVCNALRVVRRCFFVVGCSVLLGASFADDSQAAYTSPYTVTFTCNNSSLTYDFASSPRNDTHLESSLDYSQWYDSGSAYYTDHARSWGPQSAQYPAVTVPSSNRGCDEITWKRERLIAVAKQYIGYTYQHHHIPDFDPYPVHNDWPDSNPAVLAEHPVAGIDCSNFSSWNYNFGHGINLNGDVVNQSQTTTTIPGPGGSGSMTATVIGQGMDFATLCNTLVTGDLLYIRSGTGQPISHVIMWVGAIGSGPDPLVIDSHDNSPIVYDSSNVAIPPGVHLRPFREGGYYFTQFDHAFRILTSPPGVPVMGVGVMIAFALLLAFGGMVWKRRRSAV